MKKEIVSEPLDDLEEPLKAIFVECLVKVMKGTDPVKTTDESVRSAIRLFREILYKSQESHAEVSTSFVRYLGVSAKGGQRASNF